MQAYLPCFPPLYVDSLLKSTADALTKWKDLLRNYTKTVDEEVWLDDILDKSLEICMSILCLKTCSFFLIDLTS